jgi:hypothetical protein
LGKGLGFGVMSVDRMAAADIVSRADSRRVVAADRRAPPVSASACRFDTGLGAAVRWAGPVILAWAESTPPGLSLFLISFSFSFSFSFSAFPIFFHIFCTFHSNQFKPVPKLF